MNSSFIQKKIYKQTLVRICYIGNIKILVVLYLIFFLHIPLSEEKTGI